MVQFIPARNSWSEAFQSIGKGVSEGYTNRSDDKAIQKAIMDLGPNPNARQVLDALTKTKTYNPESKQNALKNYLGVAEFEQLQETAKLKKLENEKKEFEAKQKKEAEKNGAIALVNNSELTEDNKKSLIDQLNQDKIDFKSIETLVKPNKNTINEIKRSEKINGIKGGIATVDEMLAIGDKGNLGWGLGLRKVFSDEANEDAGKYEQLGKSLIQLSTNIPIRNRQEFETLAHKLYDPSIRDAERKGVLSALKSVLSRSLIETESGAEEKPQTQSGQVPPGKVRVKDRKTGIPGTVTPFEGMDAKYERI